MCFLCPPRQLAAKGGPDCGPRDEAQPRGLDGCPVRLLWIRVFFQGCAGRFTALALGWLLDVSWISVVKPLLAILVGGST